MSFDIISGMSVKKVKIKKEDNSIVNAFLFYVKSHSSNVTPKTPTWFLQGIFKNEKELLGASQNWLSDVMGGSIQFSDVKYTQNEFEDFKIFMDKIKYQIRNAKNVLNNDEEFIIDESFFKIDDNYENGFQKLDYILSKDLGKTNSYFNLLGSIYVSKTEDLEKEKNRFLLKEDKNIIYDYRLDNLIELIVEKNKKIFTLECFNLYKEIIEDTQVKKRIKYTFNEYYIELMLSTMKTLTEQEKRKIFEPILIDFFYKYVEESTKSYKIEEFIEDNPFHKIFPKLFLSITDKEEYQEKIIKILENTKAYSSNEEIETYKKYFFDISTLRKETIPFLKNNYIHNEIEDVGTYLILNLKEIERLKGYSNGDKPSIVFSKFKPLLELKGKENKIDISDLMERYKGFLKQNFYKDIFNTNIIHDNFNILKDINKDLQDKCILDFVEISKVYEQTRVSFKTNEKILKELENKIKTNFEEVSVAEKLTDIDYGIIRRILGSIEVDLNISGITNKRFQKISKLIEKFLLNNQNFEFDDKTKKEIAYSFGIELSNKYLTKKVDFNSNKENKLKTKYIEKYGIPDFLEKSILKKVNIQDVDEVLNIRIN